MKINELKAGSILSYLQMIIGALVSIIYTPVMLRLLGQSEYGLYNLTASVISYLALFNLGFGSSYIRYYAKYKVKDDKEGIAKLNGLFLIVFSIIGVVALVAGIILSFNTKLIFADGLTSNELETAKILMLILSLNLALSFPASVFVSYITANEKFVFQKTLNMIKTVISPFAMLPVLLLGYKSIGMVIVTTIISVGVDLFNTFYCVRKLKIKFIVKSVDLKLLKEIALFSVFIAINSVIDQINWSIGKLLLGRYRGTAATAVYGVAAQLNSLYIQISTSISNVFTPRIHKIVAGSDNNRKMTDLFTRVGRIQFLILSMVCMGLMFFGKPFIERWAGANYSDTFYIAVLLILPVTIPLIQNLGIEIQRAKNMHQFRSIIYLFMAALNVGISIPLCKAYGGIGCAIGTCVSMVIANVFIMNIYYHKKIGLDMVYFWKNIVSIFPAFILPIITGLLLVRFFDIYKVFPLILSGAIFCLIYIISIWFIGMNQYEKELITKPTKKIMALLHKR